MNVKFFGQCSNIIIAFLLLKFGESWKTNSWARQMIKTNLLKGARWFSGRVLDSRPRGRGVRASPTSLRCGPWARHIDPSLVLDQPRKTRPCLTERLLMGCKESNQTKLKRAIK